MSTHASPKWRTALFSLSVLAIATLFTGCGGDDVDTGSDGPTSNEAPVIHAAGNPVNGKQVFRFETFGNERFWTDALRLQQGVMATGVTPSHYTQLHLSFASL